MSAKWRRSQAWDEANIPGWAWPAKFVLRAFSSISLAIVLLVCIATWGILASVPIGLVALAPTYAVYGLTLALAVGLASGLPAYVVGRLLNRAGRGARFLAVLATFLGLGALAVWGWSAFLWPAMAYDPARDHGLRFFADFCERYKASTLRRLPGVEMSELEFYGWWPLRAILMCFVVNMVTATVRRIEFNFKNLGVLTVHTGIVTIALGSVYYHSAKLEGDLLLLAGQPDPATGVPAVGPPQGMFHDNTRVALHLSVGGAFEQRLIEGLPRYNPYNLRAVSGTTASQTAGTAQPWNDPTIPERTLSIAIPAPRDAALDRGLRSTLRAAGFSPEQTASLIERGATSSEFPALGAAVNNLKEDTLRELVRRGLGRSLSLRVVGYAPYAELRPDYVKATEAQRMPGEAPRPVWFIRAVRPESSGADAPMFFVLPGTAATRVESDGGLAMEFTLGRFGGMTEERFRDLSERLPPQTEHALVVEIPGAKDAAGVAGPATRVVQAVTVGSRFAAGGTGFQVEVLDLLPQPDFPIITPGYENATSSVAKVRITTPAGESFDRWVYHRFPEITQDFLPGQGQNGMPKRRAADPSIRVGYLDCSQPLAVYADQPAPDVLRAVVRRRGGEATVIPPSPITTPIPLVTTPGTPPKMDLGLVVAERWDHSTAVERPAPVPELRQDKRLVGTHDEAALALEVTWQDDASAKAMSRTVWLPFTKYMDNNGRTSRSVPLPDGRTLSLAFGRVVHRLPGMTLRLKDFEMIAYDHRGAPRDYQSTIQVDSTDGSFGDFEHVASLNYPLQAPFAWSDSRGLLGNLAGTFWKGLNPRQFKFSQAGWDSNGWQRTQRMTDAGQLKRPFAQFTILQVGNNPGIHVIALGGILMGVGIPWAFYIKPWLVRREKRRIQEQLAAGTYVRPDGVPVAARPRKPEPAPQETAP